MSSNFNLKTVNMGAEAEQPASFCPCAAFQAVGLQEPFEHTARWHLVLAQTLPWLIKSQQSCFPFHKLKNNLVDE